MTVINTNTAALTAQYHLSQVNKEMEQAMERLSSGQRINSASDDAAGLTIASRMDAQIRGLGQAIRNANDGISMSSTAEGAMQEIESMLQRMREIAVQSSNGTYTATDRENLNNEVAQLKDEIDRVVNTTTFNGKNVLDGSFEATFQIGAFSGQTMDVNVANLGTNALGSVSGATASSAITDAAFSGAEAVTTETQLTFNGNDEYSFKLVADIGNTAADEFDIVGTVSGNSAADIVAKINAALRESTASDNASRMVQASYSGNVVTLKNLHGGDISIEKIDATTDLSAASSTISFNSIVFDESLNATASDNMILGSNAFAETTFANAGDPDAASAAGGTTVTVAGTINAGDVVLKAVVDGTTYTASFTAAGTDTAAGVATGLETAGFVDASGAAYADLTISADGADLSIASASGAAFTLAMDDATDDATTVTFTAGTTTLDEGGTSLDVTVGGTPDDADSVIELTNAAGDKFTVTVAATGAAPADAATLASSLASADIKNAAGETVTDSGFSLSAAAAVITVSRTDGAAFTVAKPAGHTSAATLTGGAALDATGEAVTATGISVDAVEAAVGDSGSIMYLDLNGSDTYELTFEDDDATKTISVDVGFTYEDTSASLTNVASVIANALNADAAFGGDADFDFEVTAEEGRIKINDLSGNAFKITAFTSEGAGKIAASNYAGQSGTGPSAALLDDTDFATDATTQGAGAADPTVVEMSFSKDDVYSFTISDGTATAVVSSIGTGTNSLTSGTAADDLGEMKAYVEAAIERVGLHTVIDVAFNTAEDTIILTHSEGSEIKIDNFASESTGIMKLEAGSNDTSGFAKFLDDGLDGSADVVANVNVLTGDASQQAVDIIDQALEDVASERANLGAVVNRLDHTINNLSNVSTNTTAAKSQIEDADFAVETSNLTKSQILSQAATSMLAQANQSKQGILALLQG